MIARDARCRDEPPDEVREGIALFNARAFFECHELLEDAWRSEPGRVRRLYQGILQVGVAFHHLGRGNWRGAVRLLERGDAKVAEFTPACMGIDTAALHAAATRCLERLYTLDPASVAEFDRSLIPTIRMVDGSEPHDREETP